MRCVRGREIGLVLQSPIASLNPAMRIGDQVHESWRAHKDHYAGPFSRTDAIELLERVSLPADESFLRRYPRQLSVGQAQRVLIAMAIVHRPRLLLADEPTSALDAVTQSEILQLFSRLSRELEMSILYISHDLLSVGSICARVAILSEGRVVEFNSTEDYLPPAGTSLHQGSDRVHSQTSGWIVVAGGTRGVPRGVRSE